MQNPDGVMVGGVWMPKTETHLIDMMTREKTRKIVDGKATYQHHKLDFALKHVKQWRTAIDIGGHVGLWSMWLTPRFAHVHAFEPVPAHADLFEVNVDMSKATLHRVALGREPGTVDIEIPLETTGNAHVAIGKRHSGTRHVENPDLQTVVKGVPMVTLDSLGLTDIDFIKIDVEGYERTVLLGGEETIRREKPVIVCEQKGNEDNYGEPKDAAAKLLQKWGAKPIKVLAGDWVMSW